MILEGSGRKETMPSSVNYLNLVLAAYIVRGIYRVWPLISPLFDPTDWMNGDTTYLYLLPVDYGIYLLIMYGLYRQNYRALAAVAFIFGFRITVLLAGVLRVVYYGSDYVYMLEDFYLGYHFILLSIGLFAGMAYYATRGDVANWFGVGSRFSQSYIYIGVCLGILWFALMTVWPYISIYIPNL